MEETMDNLNDERVEDATILEVLEQHQQTSYGKYLYQQQQQKQHHEQQKQRDGYEADDVKKLDERMTEEKSKHNKVGYKMIHNMIDVNKNTSETKDLVDDSFVNITDVDQSIISILIEHQKHQQYQEQQYNQSMQSVQVVSEEIQSGRVLPICNDDSEVPSSTTNDVRIAESSLQLQPTASTSRHVLHPRHEHVSYEKKKTNKSNFDPHCIIPGAVRVKGIVESSSFHFDDEDIISKSFQPSGIYQNFDDDDDDDDEAVGGTILTKAIRVKSMKTVRARISIISQEEQMNIIKYNNELSLTSFLSMTKKNDDSSHDINNLTTTSTSKNMHNVNEISCNKRYHMLCRWISKHFMISIGILIIFILIVIVSVIVSGHNHDNDNQQQVSNEQDNQNILQQSPTLIVALTGKAFDTGDELYRAVDTFLLTKAGIKIQSDDDVMMNISYYSDIFASETTTLTNVSSYNTSLQMMDKLITTYGRIEYWNISKINNVTSLFDATRNPLIENYLFDIDISRWDTSSIISMKRMFYNAYNFTSNLSLWDTSKVIDMESMFMRTFIFDSDLSLWDTSSVITMKEMFTDSRIFRGIGLQNWNVSSVVQMESMFMMAYLFNANLSFWDISKVQTIDKMFYSSKSFEGIGLDQWMISSINSTFQMFYQAVLFDANLSQWDTSNIVNVKEMFYMASSFRGVGIDRWNTSMVNQIVAMFYKASKFNANLSNWNMSNVIQMDDLFDGATQFTGQGLDQWDVRRVYSMKFMFRQTNISNINLTQWDVSKVDNMDGMFQEAQSFQGIGIDHWDTKNVRNSEKMFKGAISFDANMSLWCNNFDYKGNRSDLYTIAEMFMDTDTFQGIGLDQWMIPKTCDVKRMLCQANGLKIDVKENLSSWWIYASIDDAFVC